MNPYKNILESEKVIKSLISDAKTMGSASTRLRELNVLIDLVNVFKSMLENKYKTEYLDVLLLGKMRDVFIRENQEEDIKFKNDILQKKYTLPVDHFLEDTGKLLREGKGFIKDDIINMLRHFQLSNFITSKKTDLRELDSEEEWSELIEDTLFKIKKNIIYNNRI